MAGPSALRLLELLERLATFGFGLSPAEATSDSWASISFLMGVGNPSSSVELKSSSQSRSSTSSSSSFGHSLVNLGEVFSNHEVKHDGFEKLCDQWLISDLYDT